MDENQTTGTTGQEAQPTTPSQNPSGRGEQLPQEVQSTGEAEAASSKNEDDQQQEKKGSPAQ